VVFALKVRFAEVQKALTKVILCSSKPDEKNEPEGITTLFALWFFNVKFYKS